MAHSVDTDRTRYKNPSLGFGLVPKVGAADRVSGSSWLAFGRLTDCGGVGPGRVNMLGSLFKPLSACGRCATRPIFPLIRSFFSLARVRSVSLIPQPRVLPLSQMGQSRSPFSRKIARRIGVPVPDRTEFGAPPRSPFRSSVKRTIRGQFLEIGQPHEHPRHQGQKNCLPALSSRPISVRPTLKRSVAGRRFFFRHISPSSYTRDHD
jgi:hypothetical protein